MKRKCSFCLGIRYAWMLPDGEIIPVPSEIPAEGGGETFCPHCGARGQEPCYNVPTKIEASGIMASPKA